MKVFLYVFVFISHFLVLNSLEADPSSLSESLKSQHIFDTLVEYERQANDFGLCWETIDQPLDDIRSKIEKIAEAFKNGDKEALKKELGELIVDAFSIAVFCEYEPKELIKGKIINFPKKFEALKLLAKQEGLENFKGQLFKKVLDKWKEAEKMVLAQP